MLHTTSWTASMSVLSLGTRTEKSELVLLKFPVMEINSFEEFAKLEVINSRFAVLFLIFCLVIQSLIFADMSFKFAVVF